jgi:hypothetical protein
MLDELKKINDEIEDFKRKLDDSLRELADLKNQKENLIENMH